MTAVTKVCCFNEIKTNIQSVFSKTKCNKPFVFESTHFSLNIRKPPRYIGEFKDDAMNGYGIYIDENGHKSMGKFRNNEFIE